MEVKDDKTKRKMIEYKIISLPKTQEKIEAELNNLAEHRWRLVCSCGKHNRHVILKRKARVEEGEDYE